MSLVQEFTDKLADQNDIPSMINVNVEPMMPNGGSGHKK
jgi:hypothetical protein